MAVAEPTFEYLYKQYQWTPIKHCPGRFVMTGGQLLSMEDLVGKNIPITAAESEHAQDEILLCIFPGGGLISYVKPDGRIVHTLNDEDGFIRKSQQLELP